MLGLSSVTLIWFYFMLPEPPAPSTNINNSGFNQINATVLLNRFKRAIQWRSQTGLYKVITTDYTIHRCQGSIESRDHFWELIKQVPDRLVHIYELIDIVTFDEKSITTNIDGAKVVFGIRKSSNGNYQLWKETHYDCSRKEVLSSMVINYRSIASGIATKLMRFYVKGFYERSFPKLSTAVDIPYQIFYCLKNGQDGLKTIENMYDIVFPSFHADLKRRKTLIEIRDAQLYSSGSIMFSVHNGGFNHYFEATRRDGVNYKLILEKQLDCTDEVPKGFDIPKIQYAAVFDFEVEDQ